MTPYLQQRALLFSQIERKPSPNLGLTVVIPACREEHLLLSLMALHRCTLPKCDVEVLVIINDSETAPTATRDLNLRIAAEAERWADRHNSTRRWFHILYHCGLSRKEAGVGLARKIGMDEACRRLERAEAPRGIIACFDADSLCATNYLCAIEAHFRDHPKSPACSIRFEHPLRGAEYPPEIYQAIVLYELHLRYYIQAQRYAGFPHAFHTVGSSMAVRCDAYQQQGGMNRRQAGEDFYFLHKFTSSPHFSELHSTCVIPSPRPSDRVPFGTGRAVNELLRNSQGYLTYSLQTFEDLGVLFDAIPKIYDAGSMDDLLLPDSIQSFFRETDGWRAVEEARANTAGEAAFRQRFFRWFNAFTVMKFAHFARDHCYPNVPVEQAAATLLPRRLPDVSVDADALALLLTYRALDYLP